MAASPIEWLGGTTFIDVHHPHIRDRAMILTSGALNETQKVERIFEFVRDEISFGFTSGFWENKASEVLASRKGYCNTKSTLFVALLRAAGVPARQVFVDIDKRVLEGILDPGTDYVDHSYTELLLNESWVATDAYIVDTPLFLASKKRVVSESRVLGYGIHSQGTSTFDPSNSTFSQYNIDNPELVSTKKWGVYADVGDFYKRAPGTWNKLPKPMRLGFGFLAASANKRARRLRASPQFS